MMKKLATILIFVLFIALSICNVSANGDIQTVYPLQDMLLDYEFDDTANGLSGFQTRNVLPTLVTEDGAGAAMFEKIAGDNQTNGISFKSSEDVMVKLKEALKGGEVAFELRAKPVGVKPYLSFANKLIQYNINSNVKKIQFNGKNVADISQGNWYTVAFILDFSGDVPALKKLEVEGVSYQVGGYTVPTFDTIFGNSNTALWTFLYPGYCEVGDKVYLDYFRIYSVKQLKYQGCNINLDGMNRDERNIELYFNHPLDEASVITSASLKDEKGDEVGCMTGLGAEENVLLFTLDDSLNYGGYYTITLQNLKEKYDGDKVKLSMNLNFFVENKPEYTFTEWKTEASEDGLSGSVAVTNSLPKERKLLLLTQFYDEENKLISVQNSGEITVLPGAQEQTVNLFSNVVCPSAVKAKVFVFSESYKYILESYMPEIER